VRAGRLDFGRVTSVCRSLVDSGSFVESSSRCGTESLETEVAILSLAVGPPSEVHILHRLGFCPTEIQLGPC